MVHAQTCHNQMKAAAAAAAVVLQKVMSTLKACISVHKVNAEHAML